MVDIGNVVLMLKTGAPYVPSNQRKDHFIPCLLKTCILLSVLLFEN